MEQLGKRETLKLTLKNFSYRFSADVFSRLLLGIVGIILANYLGAEENGRYNLVYSYFFIVVAFSEAGLFPILMRELSTKASEQNPELESALMGNALVLKLFFTTITFCIAAVLALLFPSLVEVKKLIWIALFALYFHWENFFSAAFEAKLRLKFPALIQSGMGLLTAMAIIVLIFLKAQLMLFIVIRTILAIPETMLYVLYIKRFISFRFKPSPQLMVYLLRESLPLLASNICIAIHLRVDQFFLNFYYGKTAVGVYAAAVNLIEPLWLLPVAFANVTAPLLARVFISTDALHRYERFYKDCFRLLNMVSWPMALGGTLLSSSIIGLFYRPEFMEADLPFSILLWGTIFVYVGILNARLMIVIGKQEFDLLFTSSSLMVNIIFNFLLIPSYGIIGAAIASLLTFATGPVMGYFLKTTHDYSLTMLKTSARPFGAALLMFFALFPLKDHPIMAVTLGMLLYFFLLRLLGGISNEDVTLLKSLVQKERLFDETND